MTHILRRLVVAGFTLCAFTAMAQAPLTATDARDLTRVIERRIQELAPSVSLNGTVTSRVANGAVVVTAPGVTVKLDGASLAVGDVVVTALPARGSRLALAVALPPTMRLLAPNAAALATITLGAQKILAEWDREYATLTKIDLDQSNIAVEATDGGRITIRTVAVHGALAETATGRWTYDATWRVGGLAGRFGPSSYRLGDLTVRQNARDFSFVDYVMAVRALGLESHPSYWMFAGLGSYFGVGVQGADPAMQKRFAIAAATALRRSPDLLDMGFGFPSTSRYDVSDLAVGDSGRGMFSLGHANVTAATSGIKGGLLSTTFDVAMKGLDGLGSSALIPKDGRGRIELNRLPARWIVENLPAIMALAATESSRRNALSSPVVDNARRAMGASRTEVVIPNIVLDNAPLQATVDGALRASTTAAFWVAGALGVDIAGLDAALARGQPQPMLQALREIGKSEGRDRYRYQITIGEDGRMLVNQLDPLVFFLMLNSRR